MGPGVRRDDRSNETKAIMITLTTKELLPEDGTRGTLVGRVWLPQLNGPATVAVRADGVFDVTARFATVSALCEQDDPATALRGFKGQRIGDLGIIAANTPPDRRDPQKPWLLAPLDLQVLKAAGWNPRDLYISIGRVRRVGTHIVLLARAPSGFYVLDDRANRPVATQEYHAFTPIMTLGVGKSWIHGRRIYGASGRLSAR